MQTRIDKKDVRRRIRYRIRKKLQGTPERPRLAVFRSEKHIYAQAIDDSTGKTVAHASSLEASVRGGSPRGANVAAAKAVGSSIAAKLKEKGVESIVFDRGGFLYHGRVKALAEAAREAGLKF